MHHLPIWLTVKSRSVLVVGGTSHAARKVRLVRKASGDVTVVAPRADGEITAFAGRGEITLIRRDFLPGDVKGRAVVYSATGVDAVDRRVSAAARAAGVPVNVVDRPDLSTFIMPAIVDRSPVVIGISSAGTAPVLARQVRARIESLLPDGLGRLAGFADSFRSAVKAVIGDARARRRFWERFFDGPVARAVLRGDVHKARERMVALINGPEAARRPEGAVSIVGAGPGNADLLTLRALRLLQEADVVVYDRLVGPDILDYARRDAERIYVGKGKGRHTRSQAEINALLTARAKAGQRVVRLKGGDPYIFGRGGEEMVHLRRAGVPVEVVPGITAAAGCGASAGIPLTHRDYVSAVTFVTGHATSGEPDLDWAALATGRHTLVVYMGVSTAGTVARRLIEHGMDPATPATIVENGTRADEVVVVGSVADLEHMVAANRIVGPAVIVVGDVVRLAGEEALPALARAVAV